VTSTAPVTRKEEGGDRPTVFNHVKKKRGRKKGLSSDRLKRGHVLSHCCIGGEEGEKISRLSERSVENGAKGKKIAFFRSKEGGPSYIRGRKGKGGALFLVEHPRKRERAPLSLNITMVKGEREKTLGASCWWKGGKRKDFTPANRNQGGKASTVWSTPRKKEGFVPSPRGAQRGGGGKEHQPGAVELKDKRKRNLCFRSSLPAQKGKALDEPEDAFRLETP